MQNNGLSHHKEIERVRRGWIKLYRVLLDDPVWKLSTPEQKAILVTILLMVNHDPAEWEWAFGQAGYTGDYSFIFFE